MSQAKRPTTPEKRLRSAVETAKAAGKRQTLSVGGVPGLRARVAPGGAVAYLLKYRAAGVQRSISFRADDLGSAREHAREVLALARGAAIGAGVDPWEAKRSARVEASRRRVGGETVAALVEKYLVDAGRRLAPSTVTAYENILAARVLPRIGSLRPDEVTRAHVRGLVDAVRAEGKPVHANRVLAAIKALFSWALERDVVAFHPATGLKATSEDPDDRVFSNAELVAILAGSTVTRLRLLVPFLLATLARPGEALRATWSDVDSDGGVWTIRATEVKGGDRALPLSPLALEILAAVPRKGPRVFPMAHPQSSVEKIREVSGVEDFRLHGLRRTARTRLSGLGIAPDVAERILGHSLGKIRGTYDRFDYLEPMRGALTVWGEEVARIAKGK